jgi:hypothetical protein
VPGVELVPGTVALDGRSGIAVALDHNGYRQEVDFDPATADLISTSNSGLATTPDYPSGAVIRLMSFGLDLGVFRLLDRWLNTPKSNPKDIKQTKDPCGHLASGGSSPVEYTRLLGE